MPLARLVLTEPWKAPTHTLVREDPFLIGRHPHCQLVLSHPSVSKEHARISRRGSAFLLEDLKSKNGTALNGAPLQENQSKVLEDEDLISVGGQDLIFRIMEQSQLDADLENQFGKMKEALRLSSEISGASMLDQILDQVINGLLTLTRADRALLMLSGSSGLDVARSHKITSAELEREDSRLSQSAIQRAIETRAEVVIADASSDTYFGRQESVMALSLRTLVCVPILSRDSVLGVLYADSSGRDHAFTEIDVEVLKSLATSAAIAIENDQLNRRVRDLLEQATRVLEEVENAAHLDVALQDSVRQTLTAINSLKFSGSAAKPHLGIEPNLG